MTCDQFHLAGDQFEKSENQTGQKSLKTLKVYLKLTVG
jgi:hypothetical protein